MPTGIDGILQIHDIGGVSVSVLDYHKLSEGNNNADVIKSSAGQIYGIHVFNNAGYPVYIKFYDKSTAPNPSIDVVVRTVGCQAGIRVDDIIGFSLPFATGIAIAIVKGISDTDNTAVLANDCIMDVDYV